MTEKHPDPEATAALDAPGNPREAYERRGEPGTWAVEDFGDDGECYMAAFYGPEAKERAEEYAAFKYDAHRRARSTSGLAESDDARKIAEALQRAKLEANSIAECTHEFGTHIKACRAHKDICAALSLAAPVSENHEPTASQRAACLFAKTQADASGRPQSEVNAIVRESLINMAAKDVTPGAEKEEDQ